MKANCKKRACVRPEAKMKNKVEEYLNFDIHARRGRLVRRGPVREKASGPCPICVVSCVGRVASPRAQPVCSGGPAHLVCTPARPNWPTLLNAEFMRWLMPLRNCGVGTLPLAKTAEAAATALLLAAFEE